MSDDKDDTGDAPKKKGWLKTIFGTFAGLFSGAVMMYLSPLLDKVIKPSKPIANFAFEVNGTTVTFYNHSSGNGEGWFDFGDGSSLEPVSPKQPTITHKYAKADSYSAKLTWRSLFGEENDRTVKVDLAAPKGDAPAVLSLDAVPTTPTSFAPATFQLVGKTKNASLCVWDCGEDHNLEFSTPTTDDQVRLITFNKPGGYVIKLAAVNGDVGSEKSTIVYVDEPPCNCLTAMINVLDQGTRVDRIEKAVPIAANWPPGFAEAVYPIDRTMAARRGCIIVDAKVEVVSDRGSRSLAVAIAPDRQSVHLTGELVKDASVFNRNAPLPGVMLKVHMTMERRTAETRPAVAMTAALNVPGNLLLALPPVPTNWVDAQRHVSLQLREGDQVIWQGSELPRNVPITAQKHPCLLNAIATSGQIRIDLTQANAVIGKATP